MPKRTRDGKASHRSPRNGFGDFVNCEVVDQPMLKASIRPKFRCLPSLSGFELST
jgi:hypothetical protein